MSDQLILYQFYQTKDETKHRLNGEINGSIDQLFKQILDHFITSESATSQSKPMTLYQFYQLKDSAKLKMNNEINGSIDQLFKQIMDHFIGQKDDPKNSISVESQPSVSSNATSKSQPSVSVPTQPTLPKLLPQPATNQTPQPTRTRVEKPPQLPNYQPEKSDNSKPQSQPVNLSQNNVVVPVIKQEIIDEDEDFEKNESSSSECGSDCDCDASMIREYERDLEAQSSVNRAPIRESQNSKQENLNQKIAPQNGSTRPTKPTVSTSNHRLKHSSESEHYSDYSDPGGSTRKRQKPQSDEQDQSTGYKIPKIRKKKADSSAVSSSTAHASSTRKPSIDSASSNKSESLTPSKTHKSRPIDPVYRSLSRECTANGCAIEFISITELEIHLIQKHRALPIFCPAWECTESFDSNSKLNEHCQKNHFYISSWKCDHCVSFHKSAIVLNEHRRVHHEKGQFKCIARNCGKIFKYRIDTIEHYNSSHR